MSSRPLKILFAGTPGFAAAHLSALLAAGQRVEAVYTQPDRRGKRGNRLQPSPVKEAAAAAGVPVYQPAVLDAKAIEEIATFEPDLMVVVAYGHKLPADLLSLPRHGCINVHASLLPRWRGAAPIQRAILHGDRQSGITIMRIDEGWDTGDILLQRECAIDARETAPSLEAKLLHLGQEALIEALTMLQGGALEGRAQEEEGASYARKIEKEEALIDWSRDAVAIDRAVRAYVPDPVAHTYLGDLRVRLWEAQVLDPVDDDPGEIVAASRDGIDVACGEGALRIIRLQLPIGQGRVLTVSDLLNARRDLVSPGTRFSSSPATG